MGIDVMRSSLEWRTNIFYKKSSETSTKNFYWIQHENSSVL